MGINRRDFTLAAAGLTALTSLPIGRAEEHALEMRPIPSSGERIPIIGLGTNRYGVGDDAQARKPLIASLRRFHELGGTLIDTAPQYRSSESVLGDLIAQSGIRQDLFVATKTDKTESSETEPQMTLSLERLKTDSVDLMQIHNLRGWRHTIPILNEWKQEGRVRYTGITTSRSAQYDELESIISDHALDFLQINYSLEQQTAAERLLPLARDRGMAVIINRAFGGGRLFRAVGDKPLPEFTKEFGCKSWAQFLLKYALSHPATTAVIPGMTKVRHVDDNMAAARSRMPDPGERAMMEDVFRSL